LPQAPNRGGITRIPLVLDNSTLPPKKGKYVEINVEDKGVGISKEHLGRIFEPYFTTKQKGSGLGLATTYSIVKNHGGNITAKSTPTVGSTFTIYLPASKKILPKKEEAVIQPSIVARGRILVMDDEEVIQLLLSKILTGAGYEVELSSEGAEAIEMYRQAKESGKSFDAVIMDLTIPGLLFKGHCCQRPDNLGLQNCSFKFRWFAQ
ncbi:ATP-binding protein, partial [Chloroflexota bacterium]